ncbi:hypothetical protein B0T11DRAFT_269927 [Plectosphaerella cucumerina]|uniref:C2H2-type domain-containing protein n=1 Tax=Plectosphaerella cucumerina TaxID=40658 RepID=A0A8K0TRC3_9PEZI|nr:hypothetical protein B0T11DRAFT_269927 [Plectosphaerella cucumerina]
MSGRELSTSLADLALCCKTSMERLLTTLREMSPKGEFEDDIVTTVEALGRFIVWTEDIGLFEKPRSSSSSIEHRLLGIPALREIIWDTLEELNETALRAEPDIHLHPVVVVDDVDELNALRDSLDPNDEEDMEILRLLDSSATESTQLTKSLAPMVDTLSRTGVLLNRQVLIDSKERMPAVRQADDPGSKATRKAFTSCILEVADKEIEPWFQRRLLEIFERRHAFLVSRHDLPGHESIDKLVEGKFSARKNRHFRTNTTGQSTSEQPGKSKSTADDPHAWALSFFGRCLQGKDGELLFPSLDASGLKGLTGEMLSLNEPFQCPLCQEELVMETQNDWSTHILRDMVPYACTFQDCRSLPMSTLDEWSAHEIEFHRRAWKCRECRHLVPTKEDLGLHFRTEHARGGDKAASGICLPGQLVEVYKNTCPFCDRLALPVTGDNQASQFYSHVGQHMQKLAMLSVPLALTVSAPGAGNMKSAQPKEVRSSGGSSGSASFAESTRFSTRQPKRLGKPDATTTS